MQRFDYAKVAPGAYHAMLGLEKYLHESGLEESLLHLIKLRASQMNGCAYCIDMHWKDAKAVGAARSEALRAECMGRESVLHRPGACRIGVDRSRDTGRGEPCLRRGLREDAPAFQRKGSCRPYPRGRYHQCLESSGDLGANRTRERIRSRKTSTKDSMSQAPDFRTQLSLRISDLDCQSYSWRWD